jgi:hypothetical protein
MPTVVGLDLDAHQLDGLDLEPGLLAELAAQAVHRRLGLIEDAARQVPVTTARLICPAREQDATVALEDALHARDRVRPVTLAAGCAHKMIPGPGEFSAAAGTEAPVVQDTHEEDMMENPEPTEDEQELAATERQQEEEDMRGTTDPTEDNLPTEDE